MLDTVRVNASEAPQEARAMADKTADLAGPGIGNYEDLATALPDDYSSALSHRETMEALFAVKTLHRGEPLPRARI